MAWTEKQFKAAMREAGWKLDSKVGTYTHRQTGRVFHPFNWTNDKGEAWREWAKAMQTPPPFTR